MVTFVVTMGTITFVYAGAISVLGSVNTVYKLFPMLNLYFKEFPFDFCPARIAIPSTVCAVPCLCGSINMNKWN